MGLSNDTPHHKENHQGQYHDHKHTQSLLYYNNKDMIDNIQNSLSTIVTMSLVLLIFISSWKNMEQGSFPFNIGILADIAYAKHKFGTPALALFITFVTMYTLIQIKYYMQTSILFLKDVVGKLVKRAYYPHWSLSALAWLLWVLCPSGTPSRLVYLFKNLHRPSSCRAYPGANDFDSQTEGIGDPVFFPRMDISTCFHLNSSAH